MRSLHRHLPQPALAVALAVVLAAPAQAGPIQDAFAAFIDQLRAQGRAIVEGAMPGGWRETPTAALEPRVDQLPLGREQYVIFVAPACFGCRQAEAALRKRGFEVEVLDVTTSKTAREAYALAEGQGLPTMLIGNQRLTGWNERLFNEALRRVVMDKIRVQQGQGA